MNVLRITARRVAAGLASIVIVAAATWSGGAPAQGKYPDRPVRVIVPFAPGGGTDATARQFAERMTTLTGQPFIVENRAGASTQIGTEAVAKSPPDGYTLLFSTSTSLTLLPAIDPSTRFDVLRDFDAVAIATRVPLILVVPASLGVKDLATFRQMLKDNPGKYSYGSAGTGTGSHVAAAYFAKLVGAEGVVHVPYKSAGAAATDLLGGRITYMFDAVFQQAQHVKAGSVVALAVTDTSRVPSVPDVPTMTEAGFPEFTKYTWTPWQGFLAPKGTPRAILEQLNDLVARASQDAGLVKQLKDTDQTPMSRSLPESQAFVDKEVKEWAGLVKSMGIKAD